MEAGQEMDKLVAEKVMGAHAATFESLQSGVRLWSKSGACTWVGFNPSETIADAWAVLEELGFNWTLSRDVGKCGDEYETKGGGKYRFIYASPGMPMEGIEADTAPLAICLAALKAVGVEVPS